MGIVVDSDIPQVKYLMELTESGFIKNEYISRVLFLKSEGNIFGVKRLRRALDQNQSQLLRTLTDRLVTTFGTKKAMESVYEIDTSE